MTAYLANNLRLKPKSRLKFMSIARHFPLLSASLAIALTCGMPAMAQSLPASEAKASDLLPPELPLADEPTTLFPGEPAVAEIQQMNNKQSAPATPVEAVSPTQSPEASQDGLMAPSPQFVAPPSPPPSSTPPLERVKTTERFNPSGNPLLFPTKPGEVKIDQREPITLQQALELAIRNNRDFQRARIQLEEQRAALQEQRAALYPTLDFSNSFSRQNQAAFRQDIGVDGLPRFVDAGSTTNVFGRVGLTYNIYTGGEREARIRGSERQLRRQEIQVEVIGEDTRFNATDRYYELQRTDAQVAIAQATIEDSTQTLRDARLLEQAGLGTRFDVLRAEADLATANQQLTLAISRQRTARRSLAQVLSLGQQIELSAADEIQPAGIWKLSLEQSIVQSYKNRGELEQFLLDKEIAEQERSIALAGIKPRVDFLAEYNYNDNFDDIQPVATGYNFVTRVTWQFFDGGRAFAGARRANRRMDEADTQFASQRNEIRFRVEQSYYSLIANGENIESTRATVIAREEQLRLARLRFQAGVGTQTEVIDAQRDLARARVDFLNAIVDYNQSLNGLQRAVSNLPTNRLFDVETQP
jgi:OMF family outer membrane factor